MTEIDERWGEGALADLFLGPIAEIDGVRELFGRAQRRGASPTMGKYLWQALMEIDVRDVLGSVEAPTLVLGKAEDRIAPVEAAKAMAASIPTRSSRSSCLAITSSAIQGYSPRPSSTSSSAPSRLSRPRTALLRPSCSPTSSARPRQ